MSYGVALRNGIPFTLGTIAALCVNATSQWTPLALWPDGISTPGMWISPSTLPASFNDYTGTTPVATPGSVADSANPVGLALDIRAGAPDSLGPELSPSVNWSGGYTTDAGRQVPIGWYIYTQANVSAMAVSPNSLTFSTTASLGGVALTEYPANSNKFTAYSIKARKTATGTGGLYLYADTWRLIVPADAAVGDWYSASFETVAGIPPVISGLTAGGSWEVEYLSFKEIPGNHMLQSTSAARPVASALVNLLTKTEELNNAIWTSTVAGSTITSGVSDPLGGTTAFTITATSPNGQAYQNLNTVTLPRIASGYIRRRSGSGNVIFYADGGAGGTNITAQVTPSWMPFSVASSTSFGSWYVLLQNSGDAIDVWHPQVETGSVATTYQRVGAASDYTATGFPIYQKYDGVDDGMATASFAAGTLINGMDCMIPVRRDSGANCVAGLYNGIADATKFFGMAESASGSGCVGSGAGTPTVWVDNTQLTGGTAVTRGTLHTALTAGSYHILEFRNLDLSAWTATGFGLYTSYVFPGARGDIMLYPSTASTEDKDAARQWLADYYGVTLP